MQLRFSRRKFLSSTTLSAVSLMPFAKALTPPAYAAPNAKFLVVMYNPFGVVRNNWFPTGTGRNFTLKPSSAPLAAIKDDIIIFSRLDNAMGEKNECRNGLDQHQAGVSSLFAGANMKPGKFGSGPGAPTIDSLVGKHLEPNKHHDQSVINLGVRTTEHGDAWIRYLFLKTDGSIVNSLDNPELAFTSLFGKGGAAPVATPQKPFTGLKDALKDDLLTFERRLATPERERFQQYMESFAAYEKSLAVEMAPENLCKDLPSLSSVQMQIKAGFRSANIWPIAKLQMQLGVLALSCGARRVATLHLTDGFNGYLVPPGPTPDTGVYNGHDLSHHTQAGGDPIKLRTNLNFNHAKLFVDFVNALKASPNPLSAQGTLFDDTVMLWSSCISGEGGGGHSKLQIPFTLAAGKNAGFVTGRHLDANFGTNSMLLRGVCNAFGMPDKPFGDAEFSPAPLGGLKEDVGVAPPSERTVMQYKGLTDRCRGHAA